MSSVKDCAVYVKPECETELTNALQYAIDHRDVLNNYQQRNYQKIVENYTWDKVAKKYVAYLESIGVK